MVARTVETVQHTDQDIFITEEEERELMENLARAHFDMSLDEFTAAWLDGRFDDDYERHSEVVRLAMMLPEYWAD